MRTKFLNLLFIMAVTTSLVNCKKKADEASTSDAETVAVAESTAVEYTADASQSSIEWKGSKPTGTHNGTINIENGTLEVQDGIIQSGAFLIDMSSITVLDMEGEYKDKLENHLKGTVEGKEDHFFDVNKFPSAAFEVTGSETIKGKTNLSGNLTIKGIKNNITFPVTVSNEGDVFTLTSDTFTIDRTKWNVNYGSKSIFDDLGDSFVNDEVDLKIIVVANKKA